MPKKLCKFCKYWGKKTVAEQDGVKLNTYGKRHYCFALSNQMTLQMKSMSDDNDLEAAAHGVGWAAVCTGPNFGCIHWEEK